ncbi:hypothetical protein CALCODRAFT_490606 [Calocera cornea HHB12733]|uniref:Hydrophobin n=1 Tax=Calocera cornea HHB12733 TaxID=1353952 RepID=A0A165JMK9_9BASI|nr:hypothetical protein CALCODRAFT_490606 [Calocera cornea HHB12733]
MHAFSTLITLPLVLLAALPALASPTLHPRLHAASPREFNYDHHHYTHTRTADSRQTAAAVVPAKRNPVGDCNVAGQHCCNTTVSHNSTSASVIAGLLGSSLMPGDNLMMGLDCTPLAPLLSAGGQCTATTVCCSGDQTYNGLINVGCSPFEL